ncbi:MAG: hypothetical protein ACKVU4_03150 [Phycisphaerales bacterium]
MRSNTHPVSSRAARFVLQRPAACGLAAALAAAPGAAAQCSPAWDTAVGNPGAGTGYVGAILPWDDGVGTPGEDLYAGGSFEQIGGQNRRAIARWNKAANTWSTLGPGIIQENTTFVAALAAYNAGGGEQLIVGGAFGSGGGVPGTKSMARWNGTSWSATGSQFVQNTADSVWALKVWNGKLYVGGGFANVGGVVGANGIASWDGVTWAPLGSGITGTFSPVVFKLEVFNDGTGEALYAAGRFAGVGGVPNTALIARWNGAAWSVVGPGLFPSSALTGVEAMAVYDAGGGPALFVGGNPFIPSGQPTASVASWNGAAWTTIGQNLGGRTTCLAAFDDGSGAGPQLYNGGTAQPAINYIARYVGGQWVTVDGGVTGTSLPSFPGGAGSFPSVFSMGEWDDTLYVGGNFTVIGGLNSNGLVARTSCPSCYADCNASGNLTVADFGCFQGKYVLGCP